MTNVVLVEATDTFTHVAISGRLDPAGVGKIEQQLTSETVDRRKPAVIDLTGVEFIGSIGIGMLIGTAQAMRGHGVGMVVIATTTVKNVLDAVRIGSLFPVVATTDEAFRALGLS